MTSGFRLRRFRGLLIPAAGLLLTLTQAAAQGSKFIPPPLRIHIPFESAWKGMLETFEKRELGLKENDRIRGHLQSEFREYISGPLTEGHLAKIGEKPKITDGEWVRVKYQYDVQIDLIQEKETLVTVNAQIQALKREFLGTEKWIPIPTNGNLEEGLLNEFGQALFGQSFSISEPKKGFWEREPRYLPNLHEQIPKVVGPERP